MTFYKNSYLMGLAQEQRVLPVLRNYFHRDIQKIGGRFARHDFECSEFTYEIKSRNNKINTYSETLITHDKVDDLQKPLILVFNFTDAIAYIQYDEKRFEPYKKMLFGRTDRDDPPKIHIYIPVSELIKIDNNWDVVDGV